MIAFQHAFLFAFDTAMLIAHRRIEAGRLRATPARGGQGGYGVRGWWHRPAEELRRQGAERRLRRCARPEEPRLHGGRLGRAAATGPCVPRWVRAIRRNCPRSRIGR